MNWSQYLDDFGRRLLEALGEDPDWLPTDRNPITEALKSDDFVNDYGDLPGFNRTALCKVVAICQMNVFDTSGGPEGDDKPKALRRHWYSYFKTRFAQPLAKQLGDVKHNAQGVAEMNDTLWAQRLSQTYGEMVTHQGLTYLDLWVDDASRMMDNFYDKLFMGCHIIVAVEKDSLFGDFKAASKSLGATTLYSGKGKSSKAAIEKVLRDHYGWSYEGDVFDPDEPLIILHISDYDFDGESVIGPTFAEQARRYTNCILEARVGVDPIDVSNCGHDPVEKWYTVKVSNSGYQRWAEEKALFLATCMDCGNTWPIVGTTGVEYAQTYAVRCPKCEGTPHILDVSEDSPHGFEVEALKTRDYYGLLVDALLNVLPFDYILGKLRDECRADHHAAAYSLHQRTAQQNDSYLKLVERIAELEEIKQAFDNEVMEHFKELGEPMRDHWRDLEDDPYDDEFRNHVIKSDDYTGPWRPFSERKRTAELKEWMIENDADAIQEFRERDILGEE